MPSAAVDDLPIAPHTAAASVVTGLFVYDVERETPRVSIPHPESHLVVRFGPSIPNQLDVYAFGAQEHARRKRIGAGHRIAMARLHLGAHESVLGVPASAIAGRYVELRELWGDDATRDLLTQLAAARTTLAAAQILERAINERSASTAQGPRRPPPLALALEAAARLSRGNVQEVADDLGVSERHLRRVFRESVGVSPKAFAKLARFHRALRAARKHAQPRWASIASAAGYYDQAHLIADFRAITGATPQALLGELGTASAV